MEKVFVRNSSSKNLSPKVLWREPEKQTLEQRFWELQFRKSKKIICRNQINRKILAFFKIFILIFQIEQFRKKTNKNFLDISAYEKIPIKGIKSSLGYQNDLRFSGFGIFGAFENLPAGFSQDFKIVFPNTKFKNMIPNPQDRDSGPRKNLRPKRTLISYLLFRQG